MPEVPGPALEAETIRRIAGEEVALPLALAELDALHNLLNQLLDEIRQISPRDRTGRSPRRASRSRSG